MCITPIHDANLFVRAYTTAVFQFLILFYKWHDFIKNILQYLLLLRRDNEKGCFRKLVKKERESFID